MELVKSFFAAIVITVILAAILGAITWLALNGFEKWILGAVIVAFVGGLTWVIYKG